MSTRSQIIVGGYNASIYRHSDGYPSAVLPDILPFIANFMKSRNDPSYLTARLTGHLIKLSNEWFDGFIAERKAECKTRKEPFNMKDYADMGLCGYGIDGHTGTFHGDEEYIYVIMPDHVEVRTCNKEFCDRATLGNTTISQLVKFDGEPYKTSKEKQLI